MKEQLTHEELVREVEIKHYMERQARIDEFFREIYPTLPDHIKKLFEEDLK